ncbi:hypothetical protein FACS1894113_3490 [Alphaproteobacteria bacterium]|nr:hypothetical protein FACS1894113_3490 [Alphaproteobacteria bacterium]
MQHKMNITNDKQVPNLEFTKNPIAKNGKASILDIVKIFGVFIIIFIAIRRKNQKATLEYCLLQTFARVLLLR